jgi:hypothetical protein
MYTRHLYETSPAPSLRREALQEQNPCFKGTGGVSQENQDQGLRPAFMDTRTGEVYASCFGGGPRLDYGWVYSRRSVLHARASGRRDSFSLGGQQR